MLDTCRRWINSSAQGMTMGFEELEDIARETEARGGTGRALLRAIVTSPSFRQ